MLRCLRKWQWIRIITKLSHQNLPLQNFHTMFDKPFSLFLWWYPPPMLIHLWHKPCSESIVPLESSFWRRTPPCLLHPWIYIYYIYIKKRGIFSFLISGPVGGFSLRILKYHLFHDSSAEVWNSIRERNAPPQGLMGHEVDLSYKCWCNQRMPITCEMQTVPMDGDVASGPWGHHWQQRGVS